MKSKHQIFFFALLFLLPVFNSTAQEDTLSNKFSVHSFSISPVAIYLNDGLAVGADVSFKYGKHIFSLAAGAGSEVGIFSYNDSFSQANLLYGREYGLTKRIYADVGIGAGYFYFFSENRQGDVEKETIGFPIRTKLRIMLGRRYSMGLQLLLNVNSVHAVGVFGIVLQWNFKRKW